MEDIKPSLCKRQKRRNKRLAEELIECYRGGGNWSGAKGYKKRLQRDIEGTRSKEGMKYRHNGGSKWPTDNLEPLVRFLNTHTGKHWDKVYAELSRKMDKKSMTGLHVFQHLHQYVRQHVFIEGGKVYGQGYSWKGGYIPLTSHEKNPTFYVHPKTGVLLKAPIYKRA